MKILEKTWQHRRDFHANLKCEFCGNQQALDNGYDDEYYHLNVLPAIKCKECNKSTISEGGEISPAQTKYPDGFQI